MSGDELILHGDGIDQSLPLNKKQLSDIFDPIDQIVVNALRRDDIDPAFSLGRKLINNIKLNGLKLARLLYKMYQHWDEFGLGDSFQARIMDEWGLSPQTITKYINVIKSIFENDEITEDTKLLLAEKPIRTLVRLIGPANDSRLDDDEWEAIANAADDREVTAILSPKKKENIGRPGMIIMLRQDGSIAAYEGNESAELGILRTGAKDMENPLRYKGIERIKRTAGFLEGN